MPNDKTDVHRVSGWKHVHVGCIAKIFRDSKIIQNISFLPYQAHHSFPLCLVSFVQVAKQGQVVLGSLSLGGTCCLVVALQ